MVERESDPQFAQVPAGEMVVVATFSIQGTEDMERVSCVAIPFINLERAIGKLSSQTRFADIRHAQTEDESEHSTASAGTEIPLKVELAAPR